MFPSLPFASLMESERGHLLCMGGGGDISATVTRCTSRLLRTFSRCGSEANTTVRHTASDVELNVVVVVVVLKGVYRISSDHRYEL